MPATIEVLGQYLDHFIAEGYDFTIYRYSFSSDITVKLGKLTEAGARIETVGTGVTFPDALAKALDNFPKLPGTGGWHQPRLASPSPIIEG